VRTSQVTKAERSPELKKMKKFRLPMVPKDAYLKLLLHELPSKLPKASSADYPFISFQPNPDKVDTLLSTPKRYCLLSPTPVKASCIALNGISFVAFSFSNTLRCARWSGRGSAVVVCLLTTMRPGPGCFGIDAASTSYC